MTDASENNLNKKIKTCKKGLHPHATGKCRECVKAYNAAYHANNIDALNSNKKLKYEANREREISRSASYRSKNPKKSALACAAWRAVNPDKSKLSYLTWKKANPDAVRTYNQNRRARKLKCGGSLSKGLSEKLFKLQKGKCACCGKPLGGDYHLDHRTPLALGGSNTDDNMQLLTRICNLQKNAKDPIDFMRERGFLI